MVWQRRRKERVPCVFGLRIHQISTQKRQGGLELRWVTNLSEDRKRFYLIATLLDPRTKMLSFCDNKYFPSSWKDEGDALLSMEFKSLCMEQTQVEVNHADGQVPKPSIMDDLLDVSSTSTDVDPSSVNSHCWSAWPGSTWLCLPALRLLRDSLAVSGFITVKE